MKHDEKLTIRREVAKRMILKEMDFDYIKEISGLSKKQTKHIHQISKSFIGNNDLYLRKQYACNHHFYHRYYFERKTRYYTGVDIEKSDFYLNRYVQKSDNLKFKDLIDEIPKQYANNLRIKSILRISKYLKWDKKYFNALKLPYECKFEDLEKYDVYINISPKIKDYKEEKLVLDLLSVESNLKRIAFITDMPDDAVENIISRNSMFFTKGKLDLKRLSDECDMWEMELKVEIAKRSTDRWPAVRNNVKLLGLDESELEKYFNNYHTQMGDEFEFRKEIVDGLIEDTHSIQDISEISGIDPFYVELNVDNDYYNRFFSNYYDRYKDEKLINYYGEN